MTSDPVIGQRHPPRIAICFIGLLTAYFAAQAALRISYATSLSFDEAEMLVVTQEFALGYGASQPPLYGWLMLAAFKIFGVGIPALTITKNLLLWAAFVLMFLSGRAVLGNDLKAALTATALVTIPQIGWKAFFDLTHSVLALTMAALTFYVFLRVLRSGKRFDYVALGVCLALGVLSKYNYVIFAASLAAAAATIPAFRSRVLSRWMLLAVGLALLLLWPHVQWIWTNPALALSRVGKLGMAQSPGVVVASGQALLGLAKALVSCALLPIAVFVLIAFVPVGRGLSTRAPAAELEWRDGKQLVLRMLGISFAVVLVLVLATRTTTMRDHWLLPVLLLLPLGLFIFFERRLAAPRLKILGFASAGLALVSIAGIAFTFFFPDLTGRPPRATAPYGTVAEAVHKLGFRQGYILADSFYIGGNLKLRFPGSTVAEPEYGLRRPQGGEQSLLVAWLGPKPDPGPGLKSLWRELCGDDIEANRGMTPVTAPYEHSQRIAYTLTVVVQPMCAPKASERRPGAGAAQSIER